MSSLFEHMQREQREREQAPIYYQTLTAHEAVFLCQTEDQE